MRLFNRTPQSKPAPADPAAVTAGMRTFLADLAAGDNLALEMLDDHSEMLPVSSREWAAYPDGLIRRARIAYLGKPGPGEVPDTDLARLMDELAA